VSFTAGLDSTLEAVADLSGTVLYSDDSFNVLVDGKSILFFSDVVGAAPGTLSGDSQLPSLNDTVSLADGSHDLFIVLDTEQSAFTTPDQSGTFGLLLLASGSLVAATRFARQTTIAARVI
jgi:hypothetical protein